MQSEDDQPKRTNYQSFKKDAEALLLLVDRHVRVQLIRNTSFLGFVHSIDPVSYSVILSVPQINGHQTFLIPGHAIVDIIEMAPITDKSPPNRKVVSMESERDISLRKEKIMAWLKTNLLPVTEDGENISFANATLLPPYTVMDICTDNLMVAMQMRKIIEAMPSNFEIKLE